MSTPQEAFISTGTQLSDALHCNVSGIDEFGVGWRVDGFYENQFDDPANFNLNENAVSLVTAVLTSVSLLLFMDIAFRISVRARKDQVSKRLIFRQNVISTYSNPVSLLLSLPQACQDKNAEDRNGKKVDPQSKPSRSTCTSLVLICTGLAIVLVDFLFIFFSTNRVSAHFIEFDEVPIFEFRDRGCEYTAGFLNNACHQTALTENPGFESQANIQICARWEVDVNANDATPEVRQTAVMRLSASNIQVEAHVFLWDKILTLRYVIGVLNSLPGSSGTMYFGRQNVTAEDMKIALLSRLERTNLTILETSLIEKTDNSSEKRPSIGLFQRHLETERAGVEISMGLSEVFLNESHLKYFPHLLEMEDESLKMGWYLHDLLRSIMFPIGRGARIKSEGEDDERLTEQEPLVLYNRPWLGIIHSIAIFMGLLFAWVVLVIARLESRVDSRWAWKEFFEDTPTIKDFGRGNNSFIERRLIGDLHGNLEYGYEPKTFRASDG
ncbi:hypothetical protein FGB62_10g211 [Gracilaria domingensis]|nr:hypothetical protein FGB62_10g211 [Gracilaria domingensis]